MESAFTLINQAKEFRKPINFITDRLPSYNQAAKLLINTQHIPVKPISNDITNNLISLFIFHYNYIRPHGSLNKCTPAEVAGLKVDTLNKKS